MIGRICSVVICLTGATIFGAAVRGTWPDALGLGAILAITGALAFGLGLIPRPPAAPGAPPPLSPGAQLLQMFTAPTAVFQNLRAHPRWVTAFLAIVLCGAVYDLAFTRRLTPEAITAAALEVALADRPIPAAELAALREQQIAAAEAPLAVATRLIGRATSVFLVLSITAGLFVLGVVVAGGQISFWQALAAAFSATAPPAIVNTSLSLIVLHLKAPGEVHPIRGQRGLLLDNLGAFFSPDAQPVLYTAASFVGLISLYGLWLMAQGLRHSGERMTPRAAWTVALCLWGTNLGFNLLIAALYPKVI